MKFDPPVRSGALTVLAAGFLLSALLRAGNVVAGLPAVRDDGFANAVAPFTEGGGSNANGDAPGSLVAELRRQAARLSDREGAVEARERALADAEARLRRQLGELEALRHAVAEEAGRARTAAADDVRQLAEIYQAMKPKQAGRIFDEMEPTFAAGFLGELRADGAAAILASMSPERAYAVSVLLAGRNAGDAAAPASGQPAARVE